MKRLEPLYSGKAKTLFETDDPEHLIMEFRDDTSAFDGEIIEQFERLKNLEEQKLNNVIELKDKKKFKKKTFRKRKYYKKAK